MDPVQRAQNSEITAKRGFGRPFAKGQSGNPGGRPNKLHFSKLCEGILKSRDGKEMLREVMTDILKKKGMAAVLLMREMAERTEGKVTQPVEMSGELTLTLGEAVEAARLRRDGPKLLPEHVDAA
jgi:hypothetical protein